MKPRMILSCVASRYASKRERIVEFSFPDTNGPLGGLIRLWTDQHGTPHVDLYRVDDRVIVNVSKE